MKKRVKGFYLIISSVFIYLLHLPVVFAKSATTNKLFFHLSDSSAKKLTQSTHFIPSILSVYDSLQLHFMGLNRQAFDFAKKGFDKLIEQGRLLNDSIISIIDFSLAGSQKRLYIIDVKNYKVLFNTWVAHGKNSGREWANSFSNRPSSYKSSLGFFITGETYNGNKGYSLKLEGIEKGINDNAYRRAIVIHGAPYVDPSYVTGSGHIGRSEGCPAVPLNQAKPIINTIKEGSCLFIFHPGKSYLRHSPLLN